jgi:hypothetical protein
MRMLILLSTTVLLAACGGAGGGGKNDAAAKACETYAKTQLGEQTYSLDLKALAASAKPDADMFKYTSKILVNPGLPNEENQSMECTVRFSGETPEVISVNFTW